MIAIPPRRPSTRVHYWEGAPPSGYDRPIVLNPKSHPGILIEVILRKQKACILDARISIRVNSLTDKLG